MTTMIEYPPAPRPDPVVVVLTFIVELIQIFIAKGVLTKADARSLIESLAEKMRTDAVAAGERNADAVKDLAAKYWLLDVPSGIG